MKSQVIGPITNNPGAIYKSRHLSKMVKSAESTRNLRSQNITLGFKKRVLVDNLIGDDDSGTSFKFDIDENVNSIGFNSNYVTREIEFDI
ncbi:hypothetical protein RhiirC2_775985 [Rhizophagus irregularis]|uniref:Uncharacterized protein n=1 Tax=Rhizophagus irregularis TaxID=588596 RepID=A0A2N1NI20_9GLOM|nr:hypothetical protein RhiirC2_775985 [Rhizophagus irregularis]